MKKLSLIILFFIFQFSFSQSIDDQIKNIEQKVISWRHDFHKHPELSNREFRTSEVIAKHLESLGISVERNVGVNGVVGILKGSKEGKVVGLRADMDALPITEKNYLVLSMIRNLML